MHFGELGMCGLSTETRGIDSSGAGGSLGLPNFGAGNWTQFLLQEQCPSFLCVSVVKHWPKANLEGESLACLQFIDHHWEKPRQECKKGPWRQKLKESPWGNTAYLICFPGLFGYFVNSGETHLYLGIALPTLVWDLEN